MIAYIVRKLFFAIPLVMGVLTLIFILVELSPGDATDRFFTPEMLPEVRQMIEAKWGLDRSPVERYFIMVKNLVQGDFGVSITTEKPVFDLVKDALPNTLLLSLVTLLVIQIVGVFLGTIQAIRQFRATDTAISISSLFFYSMPSFWLALMLQLIFALAWPILPSSGLNDAVMYDYMTPFEQFMDTLKHLILPGLALGVAHAAGIARYMRSSLLEVIRQDYIRTAKAKGLSGWRVIVGHAMRNAMLPIITILGLQLPFLFSGSVLVETIFAWPGMGRLIVNSIFNQDTPVIIACFFVFTLLVVAGNLFADLLVAMVDPRIRLS